MVDVTTLVKELNVALDMAEKLEPILATFDPPVATYLLAALKGIRAIEAQLGLTPPTASLFNPIAVAQATDHVTPGRPNSAALS